MRLATPEIKTGVANTASTLNDAAGFARDYDLVHYKEQQRDSFCGQKDALLLL